MSRSEEGLKDGARGNCASLLSKTEIDVNTDSVQVDMRRFEKKKANTRCAEQSVEVLMVCWNSREMRGGDGGWRGRDDEKRRGWQNREEHFFRALVAMKAKIAVPACAGKPFGACGDARVA